MLYPTSKEGMTLKYLALIHSSDERWTELSQAEQQAWIDEYQAFAEEATAAGKLVDAAQLQPASTATTVRVRGDETLVTDGPFAEMREQIGGYFMFECESIAEAVELAAKIPGARHGTVEVRPAYVDEEAAA
jgi:hypothetical protein